MNEQTLLDRASALFVANVDIGAPVYDCDDWLIFLDAYTEQLHHDVNNVVEEPTVGKVIDRLTSGQTSERQDELIEAGAKFGEMVLELERVK